MTLDERLTRMTERHEALTQHGEMLTADVAQMSAEVRATTENVNRLVARVDELATGFVVPAQLARRPEERLDSRGGRPCRARCLTGLV